MINSYNLPDKLHRKFKEKIEMNRTSFILRCMVLAIEDENFYKTITEWEYLDRYKTEFDLSERNVKADRKNKK